jgi:hypothetical protein
MQALPSHDSRGTTRNIEHSTSEFKSFIASGETRRLLLPDVLIIKSYIYRVRVSDSLPSTSGINTEYSSDRPNAERRASKGRARRSVRTHMSHNQDHDLGTKRKKRQDASFKGFVFAFCLYHVFETNRQTDNRRTELPLEPPDRCHRPSKLARAHV